MMRWLALLPLCCSLCACDVVSVREAPSPIARNTCESTADCGGAGLCSDAKQCRAKTPTFQNVLFEVTPPDDGSPIAGVQFHVDANLRDGDADLDLGLISQVSGRVKAETLKCVPRFTDQGVVVLTDNNVTSLPAVVSLIPTNYSALGLYSPSAVVQSGIIARSYWGFSVNVAPGTYDIYVQPNRQQDESCPLPPQLLRGMEILKGTFPRDFALPAPSVFELHVSGPLANGALNGWTVDMLDQASGRVISNKVPLVPGIGGKDYVASIAYNPVVVLGNAKAQQLDQLLRLSPPDGLPAEVAAPTLLLARSALGLFDADSGTLTDFTSLPSPVHVRGQVTAGETPKPAAATVTLAATKITGLDPGLLASFVRTVRVGSDGKFDVHLLPGTYRVLTIPQSSLEPSDSNEVALAANLPEEWLVPSTPSEQAGKVIVLQNAPAVLGRVVDISSNPVASAQVQAVASPRSVQSDVLQELLGSSFVPRAAAGGVSPTGDFSFKTDPGTFDISVRPDHDTGFAWLVMPNLRVPSGGLGFMKALTMPLPYPYGGTVTVDGAEGPKPIPGALVRAYIYMKDGQYTTEVREADSVLQVGETRARSDGRFEISIPAELNQPE